VEFLDITQLVYGERIEERAKEEKKLSVLVFFYLGVVGMIRYVRIIRIVKNKK